MAIVNRKTEGAPAHEREQRPVGEEVAAPDVDASEHLGEGAHHAPDLVLEFLRDLEVVDPLLRLGVDLEQAGADDRAREVVGHQPADDVGLEDVLADLGEPFGRRFEVRRNDVAAGDTILDDLGDEVPLAEGRAGRALGRGQAQGEGAGAAYNFRGDEFSQAFHGGVTWCDDA